MSLVKARERRPPRSRGSPDRSNLPLQRKACLSAYLPCSRGIASPRGGRAVLCPYARLAMTGGARKAYLLPITVRWRAIELLGQPALHQVQPVRVQAMPDRVFVVMVARRVLG